MLSMEQKNASFNTVYDRAQLGDSKIIELQPMNSYTELHAGITDLGIEPAA